MFACIIFITIDLLILLEGEMSFETNICKIGRESLNKACIELAEFLLGKLLVRKFNDTIIKGRIVETECYLGNEDKASHSYAGR